MRTENVLPPVSAGDLERTRREVRDIVAGNTPFHDDPNAAPKAQPLPDIDYEASIGACCLPGFDRYESIFGRRHYA